MIVAMYVSSSGLLLIVCTKMKDGGQLNKTIKIGRGGGGGGGTCVGMAAYMGQYGIQTCSLYTTKLCHTYTKILYYSTPSNNSILEQCADE